MHRLLIFFFFFIFFFFPRVVYADENFTTGYDVTYTIQESGMTHVEFAITLTNRSSIYYTPTYSLFIGFPKIENVKASDPEGAMNPVVTPTDGGNKISVNFNKPAVGFGKSVLFKVSFDTAYVAERRNNVWEINIPGLANKKDFIDFAVHVQVPPSFGKPSYVKPALPIDYSAKNTLNFTKDQLQTSGISIGYGTKQVYSFRLKYHIKNKNLFPVQTEIALPPDTNYQKVYINSMSEKPTNVIQDQDGNWLAKYTLAPSEQKDIEVVGDVAVLLHPEKQPLTEAQEKLYLKERAYWEVRNATIQALAKTLKTPEAIYTYIVQNLTYDFSRVSTNKPRLGAASVLDNKTSAVCLEFTDLFIALARAAGIPAREIDGFAYTKNGKERPLSLVQDILHAWPEYYDKEQQTWIMVDPTWGNTTGGIDYFDVFDFDHIAFVIKGSSSTYPIPAGGYKLTSKEEGKDIDITLSTKEPEEITGVSVDLDIPEKLLSAAYPQGNVLVSNTGNTVLLSTDVTVKTKKLSPTTQSFTAKTIPPFGTVVIPFSFEKTSFLTNVTDTITITADGSSKEKTISIAPFFIPSLRNFSQILYAGIFITILFAAAFVTWRVHVQK